MQTNVDNSSIVRTCNTMSCPGKYAKTVSELYKSEAGIDLSNQYIRFVA